MRDEDADFVRANPPSAVIVNNPNRGHIMPDEHPGVILQHMKRLSRRAVTERRLYSV